MTLQALAWHLKGDICTLAKILSEASSHRAITRKHTLSLRCRSRISKPMALRNPCNTIVWLQNHVWVAFESRTNCGQVHYHFALVQTLQKHSVILRTNAALTSDQNGFDIMITPAVRAGLDRIIDLSTIGSSIVPLNQLLVWLFPIVKNAPIMLGSNQW